jgi:hypothetical protein
MKQLPLWIATKRHYKSVQRKTSSGWRNASPGIFYLRHTLQMDATPECGKPERPPRC